MSTSDIDVTLAYAFLLAATEPPAVTVQSFVAANGPVEAVARIRRRDAPQTVLSRVTVGLGDEGVTRAQFALDAGDVRLITPESEEWPVKQFAPLSGEPPWTAAPIALWARGGGNLAVFAERAVTIVGAKESSTYGEVTAALLASDLSTYSVTVIGRGSLGIDSAAHYGALTAGTAPTIAVLAHGIDVTYPADQGHLLGEIKDSGGLLLSECPLGSTQSPPRMAARGRLIASLGASTVIVEAQAGTAALYVARAAGALYRPVLAVPGPINSPQSHGPNQLLRSAMARAVTSAGEVMESSRLRFVS